MNYDFQKLYLDDIENTNNGRDMENYVVTGIRFRLHNDHLSLEVQMTEFDTKTKVLNPESSLWLNRLDDHEKRKVLVFNEADSPILTPIPSVHDSGLNQVIKFSSASIKKTAGQIVVPYFDGMNIFPSTRYPLSGIGLFHKGQPGYGGFISFRLLVLQTR